MAEPELPPCYATVVPGLEEVAGEEIADPLLEQSAFKSRRQGPESDWIWICLTALWQRWFPDKPSFESLDDKMQSGYELLPSHGGGSLPRLAGSVG